MFVLLALVAAAGVTYHLHQKQTEPPVQAVLAVTPRSIETLEAAPLPTDRPMLHQGMSKSEVLAIEGTPIETRGEHWWYGPSWLRFDDGQLAAWYSSPLRPLRTSQQVLGTQQH